MWAQEKKILTLRRNEKIWEDFMFVCWENWRSGGGTSQTDIWLSVWAFNSSFSVTDFTTDHIKKCDLPWILKDKLSLPAISGFKSLMSVFTTCSSSCAALLETTWVSFHHPLLKNKVHSMYFNMIRNHA